MLYYYDTSALVKAFHEEDGSGIIDQLLYANVSTTYVSDISYPEFYSTTYKKLRNRQIKKEATALQICRNFEMTLQFLNLINVNKAVYQEAKHLIARSGIKFDLRTLDALHLAIFIELARYNEITFVSADDKLCNVASDLGYDIINPKAIKPQ